MTQLKIIENFYLKYTRNLDMSKRLNDGLNNAFNGDLLSMEAISTYPDKASLDLLKTEKPEEVEYIVLTFKPEHIYKLRRITESLVNIGVKVFTDSYQGQQRLGLTVLPRIYTNAVGIKVKRTKMTAIEVVSLLGYLRSVL